MLGWPGAGPHRHPGIGIRVSDYERSKRFYGAALAALRYRLMFEHPNSGAGFACAGRDNGAPGPRPESHPGYDGAFVLEPDGHNVEAVCHRAE